MLNWCEYKKRTDQGSSIEVLLVDMDTQVIRNNREYMKISMEVGLYCAQQGIAFRGHCEGEDAANLVTIRI